MKKSALLEFECPAFVVRPGEDEETNPGVFGKSLALWLREQLQEGGVATAEPIAEDFGWCVPVESKPHSLYVACANIEQAEDQWQVFVFAEGGLMARFLGKDQSAASVASVFAAVKEALRRNPHVQRLREEAA